MNKVPGEENCADLSTTHFGAKVINRNTDWMRINFEAGRAAKAAALLAESAARDQRNNSGDGDVHEQDGGDLSDWQAVRRAAHYQRGADRWKWRGAESICHRRLTSPRLSLFTPCKVVKGPANSIGLYQHQLTYGVTAAGGNF